MSKQLQTTSVVISVHTEDRWDDILAAVGSCESQTQMPSEIIIVVDYNPTLLRRLVKQFPNHTVIASSQVKGLSGARNTGIAAATSDIVAFLDDDATAPHNWIEVLAGHCGAPNVLGAGSRVDPRWVGRRPRWFPEEFLWVVGCSYRGMPPATSTIRNPMGGAMFMRRMILERIGGFYSVLGRGASARLVTGDETELSIRARKAFPDQVFVFEPAIHTSHTVPAHRVSWKYFRVRCYAEGFSKALIASMLGAEDALSTERAYTFKTLPRGIARGILDTFLRGDPSGILRSTAIVLGLSCTVLGYVAGTLQGRLSGIESTKTEVNA
jgi:glycosyltransferase involved in cell wall biosynthesis